MKKYYLALCESLKIVSGDIESNNKVLDICLTVESLATNGNINTEIKKRIIKFYDSDTLELFYTMSYKAKSNIDFSMLIENCLLMARRFNNDFQDMTGTEFLNSVLTYKE